MRVSLLALALLTPALAVKLEDWRKCSDSSFCRRLRSIPDRVESNSLTSPYTAGQLSSEESGSWTLPIHSSLYPDIRFSLQVDILDTNVARIRMDEIGSSTPFKRYNETAKWVLLETEPKLSTSAKVVSGESSSTISYGDGLSLEIQHTPLKITQLRDGKAEVVINERSLLHMEHFRIKSIESQEEQTTFTDGSFESHDEGMFEERFKKWTDSKPKGPEALSLDITFPQAQHIYGLPEHATSLSLPDTVGPDAKYSDPLRLHNCDIFEYEADSSMALYGAIPLLHAHSKSSSVGVLNLVGSETWVDVLHDKRGIHTHWMSESGILDLLLLPGPRPSHLAKQYALLTGGTALPPQWSTAYHQCRWNYIDEADVLEVDRRFDESDIPLDVTWLDIEYAEEHRYFDWDKKLFPDPVGMLAKIADKGRKMVAIIDPHIKKVDYFKVYTGARDLDVLVKKADGTNFEGWCWTGSSVWVDFFNPNSWDWWTKMFDFGTWKDSASNLHIWNDMNEPSVFDGPEITVPKDTIHDGGWENRDVHNINGMLFHNRTAQAVTHRESPAKRPFVLSRSFFAGSQKYGAIWTGDNLGTWDHMAGETAMLLSLNIAGMSFSGADVGGFFGNPSHEMLVRWYQAGAFMPFFRAHAHIDTKRREPFLYDEPIRGYIRDMIRTRYQLLPIWYNAFHDANVDGAPIMRPQYVVFPEDEGGFAIDDQYYVGDSGLLVKPVTTEGATSAEVYISDNQPYYNYFTHQLYPAKSKPHTLTLDAPLSTFPVLIQGGSILPIRQRVRRASSLMWQDPFTLVVALSKERTASGQLYLDDGESFGYQKGEYIWRTLDYSPASKGKGGVLRASNRSSSSTSTDITPYNTANIWAKAIAHVRVEKIVILGATQPKSVKVAGQEVQWRFESAASGISSKLIIKNPGVGVVDDWEVTIA